jgi:hypothetical protein
MELWDEGESNDFYLDEDLMERGRMSKCKRNKRRNVDGDFFLMVMSIDVCLL